MNRSLTTALALVLAGSTALADSTPAEQAARAWAIADAVLARHVEPPARQQMFLAGFRALTRADRDAPPAAGLARRASEIATPGQLAGLLAELGRSGPVDADAFFEGLLEAVPGGATLLSEKERLVRESFEANLYVGIQVALGLDKAADRPLFHEVLPGGPADRSGIRAGDLIDEVDGVPTAKMPLAQVIDRLRGAEGTEVVVKVRRPSDGSVVTKTLSRERLPRPSIQGPAPGRVRLDGSEAIGYLKFLEISGSTPRELRAFAEQCEAEGARALVLDFRGVGPARFHPTVLLADALLDGGPIGRVRSVDGEVAYRAEPDALFRGRPIAVIVDGPTPPEVAWLCDALVDNRRAALVGIPTLTGPADVEETVPVPGGEWSVRMATGRLLRGNGRPVADPGSARPGASSELELAITYAPKADATAADVAARQQARALKADPLNRARAILAEILKSSPGN